MTPDAAQRASFHKDGGADPRAVLNAEALNVKNCSVHDEAFQSLRWSGNESPRRRKRRGSLYIWVLLDYS